LVSINKPRTAQVFQVAKSVVGNLSNKRHMILKDYEEKCSSKEKQKYAMDVLALPF
jgi:hypothetical protein